ncbi:hypothetical protein G6O67_000567 [Ophiocordyceps sinensis]|uniref:Uncharacterized protein n=1 Tax=Ophiocordyceps sinensis TaxID=72228 RepID=A0A8H4PZH0_9HYPO|nr:hypothetical protein G6O67_000567 [Ophiocordyceps sinensis]
MGGLDVKRYKNGPAILGRISPVYIVDPARRFSSHAEMVNALIRMASTNKDHLAIDWQLCHLIEQNKPAILTKFSEAVYNTTSFVDFFQKARIAVADVKSVIYMLHSSGRELGQTSWSGCGRRKQPPQQEAITTALAKQI